jgi:hypothetical protein
METIDPQKPDLTCSPDPTKTKAHRLVVGVDNAEGKGSGKATGLYNKHRTGSEQWNPPHPLQLAQNFPQSQSFSQQAKTLIDQHVRRGLDNSKIESFQSAVAQREILSQLEFGLGDDSLIEHHSYISGTFYYRDIIKCRQFIQAHRPLQVQLDFEPVHPAQSENHTIYSVMNTGDWESETQDQLPATATLVSLICACDKTPLRNLLGDQHAWPLYVMIVNIRKDIRHTTHKHHWIVVGVILCSRKCAKNTDEAWQCG